MDKQILEKLIPDVVATDYDERFLEMSWNWLHDEEIRYLTMSPSLTREQQRAWFTELNERSDYLIWGIEMAGQPIGAFGIKKFDGQIGEYWGYIGEKSYWGKGIGNWMVAQAIERGRSLGATRLYLKVLQTNSRALQLYIKSGFTVQSTEDKVLWMEREI